MEKVKILDQGFVQLLDHMGNDQRICSAARVSTKDGKAFDFTDERDVVEKAKDQKLINYLMENIHTSPFEQVEFVFHCKMPIFVARQWVRHRTANLNEMSGRYRELPQEFYIPEVARIQKQDDKNKQGSAESFHESEANHILGNMRSMGSDEMKHYVWMLEQGVSREVARINLPVSIYTEWYWKIDLHNLFHFLWLRMDEHAQWEIRQYANVMYEMIKPVVPQACEAWEEYKFKAVTLNWTAVQALRNLVKALEDAGRHGKDVQIDKDELEMVTAKAWKQRALTPNK